MKQKAFFVFLVLLFGIIYACQAEISDGTLKDMSIEELLSLRDEVDQALSEKGYAVYADISHGDKGENVIRLQEKLAEYGYYNGKISGKYDTETEKAVKRFQKENGLDVSGTATQDFQSFLYSQQADVLPTATPKLTAQPTPTIDPKFDGYIEIDYSDCSRYPEKYVGTKVKLVGRVVQVMGSKERGFDLRFASPTNNNIYYVRIRKGIVDFNILGNDRLTIYATMNGIMTYTSVFEQEISVPSAIADTVILR